MPRPVRQGDPRAEDALGHLILGPTARDQHEWPNPDVDPDSKEEILQKIHDNCKKLVPAFDMGDTFHSFAGARAKSDRGDWIIERSAADGSFINVAGIDSPGIAGSPAIALEAVQLLKEAGFSAPADAGFNPKRAPIIFPKEGDEGLVYTPDDKESVNAAGVAPEANVVCKCEKVTEAEIVEACKRSLPVDSTQTMRKRNRAGWAAARASRGTTAASAASPRSSPARMATRSRPSSAAARGRPPRSSTAAGSPTTTRRSSSSSPTRRRPSQSSARVLFRLSSLLT